MLIAEAGASGLANFLRPANSSGAGLDAFKQLTLSSCGVRGCIDVKVYVVRRCGQKTCKRP